MEKDLRSGLNEEPRAHDGEGKRERQDFTWPPPDDELDALEQLFISDESGSAHLPVPRPETEVSAAPRADVGETPLAHRGRVADRRQSARRVIATVTTVLPWVAAIAIGAMLGERQARINQTRPVTADQSASTERAGAAAPTVTRAATSLTTRAPDSERRRNTAAPPVAASAAATTPIRPRESPVQVPVTTPAPSSRSRSTREASNVTGEPPTTTSTATARAPVSAAGADPYEFTPTPLSSALRSASAATAIDAGPIASEVAAGTARSAVLGAATPVPSPAAPAAPAAPAVLAPTATAAAIPRLVSANEHAAIRRTLQMYEDAYDRLDAQAAAAVWPSLDVPALTRAFDGLKAQRLQFDRCDFSVGFGSATAVCSGAAQFVRRVGNPDPLVERRSWTFHLKRAGDNPGADWKIESVSTSR